ncbi:helix-turn-helix domain-containing protein [Lutimaribacter marinistellae]|uniref:Helix-turn-helix domain-containing protein n=1 Tax=Lutimaribacter marinistellae TaxID=1820329 RepID=A0ABV7TBS0_9RHOB
MAVPMVNLIEFRHVLDLLDGIASPAIVNRALRAEGLSRNVLAQDVGFLPYDLEARVIERVARTLGDATLGTHLAQRFDYSSYDAYARYVLGAKDLEEALYRGRRAFALTHPGSEILLRRQEGHVLVGRRTELTTVVGHRHLDDGAIVIIGGVIRHFLGPDWRPAWVESTGTDSVSTTYLQQTIGAPVRAGSEMPALAISESALSAPNPNPPGSHQRVGFIELPSLMRVDPPETMTSAVDQVLRTQFVLGDLSEESVASRLSLGRRSLQRALKTEATSFREVKAKFLEQRARALLAESDLDVPTIARALGYDEPHSFRRAFRTWTGLTPHAYRLAVREK